MSTLGLIIAGTGVITMCVAPLRELAVDVTVQDEQGLPVEGAKVQTEYYHFITRSPFRLLTEPFVKSFDDYWMTLIRNSNANGVSKLRFNPADPNMPVTITKDGYYLSRIILPDRMPDTPRKWTKEPIKITPRLREIKNPIPLRGVQKQEIKFPAPWETEAGFDLVKAEWMPPFGQGEHEDITVLPETQENPQGEFPYQRLTVKFSDENSGIIIIPNSGLIMESEFPFPYLAPLGVYTNTPIILTKKSALTYESNLESRNLFFRIRIKQDDEGNIIEAIYGRFQPTEYIRRRENFFIRMDYLINPTPNDRNLEPMRN